MIFPNCCSQVCNNWMCFEGKQRRDTWKHSGSYRLNAFDCCPTPAKTSYLSGTATIQRADWLRRGSAGTDIQRSRVRVPAQSLFSWPSEQRKSDGCWAEIKLGGWRWHHKSSVKRECGSGKEALILNSLTVYFQSQSLLPLRDDVTANRPLSTQIKNKFSPRLNNYNHESKLPTQKPN